MKKSVSAGLTLPQIVGQNIKANRKRLRLTQSQLAVALGVEIETISRYERGAVAPSFAQLEKMMHVLGVPAWQLFANGTDIPDTIVTELVRGLPRRDRDFILSYVKAFAAHQMARDG